MTLTIAIDDTTDLLARETRGEPLDVREPRVFGTVVLDFGGGLQEGGLDARRHAIELLVVEQARRDAQRPERIHLRLQNVAVHLEQLLRERQHQLVVQQARLVVALVVEEGPLYGQLAHDGLVAEQELAVGFRLPFLQRVLVQLCFGPAVRTGLVAIWRNRSNE